MRNLALLTLCVLLLAGTSAAEITVTKPGAMPHLSVREENAAPLDLLTRIAEKTDRILLVPDDLTAGDSLPAIDLRNRPLDEVVEIVAGSAGLVSRVRRDSITITAEPIAPEASSLRIRALAAHSWALLTFPGRPEVIETRVELAKVHAQLDQVESAIDELTRAWEHLGRNPIDTTDAKTRRLLRSIPRLLGVNYARMENWQKVIYSLGKDALDPDCDPQILLLVGRAYANIDEPRPARSYLSRLIASSSSPYALDAELLLGQLDLDVGDLSSARTHFENARRSSKASVGGTAILELVAMAERRGAHEQIAEGLAEFGKRFPEDDRAVACALKLVDTVAGPLESPLLAVKLLEKTLVTHPDALDPVKTTLEVARLWAKAEFTEKAVRRIEGELEALAEDAPARVTLLTELARILEGDLMPESSARARVVYRRLAVIPGHRQAARLRAARCLFRIAQDAPTPAQQRREFLTCLAELKSIPRDELDEADRALRLDLEVKCHEQLGNTDLARKAQEDELR